MENYTPPENPLTSNSELADRIIVGQSNIHGTGTMAARAYEKGEYIGTYWGFGTNKVTPYTLFLDGANGEKLALEGRNLLRYINHSTDPNAEFKDTHLYATRDIAAGEELTFDYSGGKREELFTSETQVA